MSSCSGRLFHFLVMAHRLVDAHSANDKSKQYTNDSAPCSSRWSIPHATEKLTYEEAFGELEETVRKLEAGGLVLQESLALFKWGHALAAYCNTQLDQAKLQIEKITADGDISLDLGQ